MKKLKVAVLEDNKDLLKDLIENLRETNQVEVVFFATNSGDFLETVKLKPVEALILDIDLAGDSMSGIDVANKLKLPVLFISGKSRDFIDRIEDLNLNHDFPIESIMKPISQDKLHKILIKFINRINQAEKAAFINLTFKGKRRERIDFNTIVFLESETGGSGESNNKKIYFTNRIPETLIDFSFSKMHEKGFDENVFKTPNQSYRVNATKITGYNADHSIDVKAVIDTNNNTTTIRIKVSENYRSEFRKTKNK